MARPRTAPTLLTALALVAVPITAWAAAAPVDKNDDYYTKKVCQVSTPTGSRLGGTRRCRTQAEWDAIRADERQTIEKVQSMKVTMCPPSC